MESEVVATKWPTYVWALLTILSSAVLYVIHKIHWDRTYWVKKGFYHVKGDVTGSLMWAMLRQKFFVETDNLVYNHLKATGRKFGTTMEIGRPLFVIADLDLVRQTLIKDFDQFVNRPTFDALAKSDPHFHNMLFLMEGDDWRSMRNKMSPTFTTGKIRRMWSIFETSSRRVVDHYKKGLENGTDEYEFSVGFGKVATDVIASAAFGLDGKIFEEKQSIFETNIKNLFGNFGLRQSVNFILIMGAPKLAKALGVRIFDKASDDFLTNVILSAIKHRRQTGEVRNDFLQLMLEAQAGKLTMETEELDTFEKDAIMTPKKGGGLDILTDDMIVTQSILFLFAGFETTKSAMSFCAYNLAQNPEIQERLHNELNQLMEDNDGTFNYDAINTHPYLEKVILETLRKYPPVIRLQRLNTLPYKIPDTDLVIPKGTEVIIPTLALQNDPDIYPNPDKFDPERFNPENKATRHPNAFMPFGHGPRNCIGMRFALMELKAVIAQMVMSFEFELCKRSPVEPIDYKVANSLTPRNGMWLRLKSR